MERIMHRNILMSTRGIFEALVPALAFGAIAVIPHSDGFARGVHTGLGLRISGHCFTVHPRPKVMVISLAYARPGNVYRFALQPRRPRGFGGGILGAHRADSVGTLHFSTTIPRASWAVGEWQVRVYHDGVLVATDGYVVLPGLC